MDTLLGPGHWRHAHQVICEDETARMSNSAAVRGKARLGNMVFPSVCTNGQTANLYVHCEATISWTCPENWSNFTADLTTEIYLGSPSYYHANPEWVPCEGGGLS